MNVGILRFFICCLLQTNISQIRNGSRIEVFKEALNFTQNISLVRAEDVEFVTQLVEKSHSAAETEVCDEDVQLCISFQNPISPVCDKDY